MESLLPAFLAVFGVFRKNENPKKSWSFRKQESIAMEGENKAVERRNVRADGEPFGGV